MRGGGVRLPLVRTTALAEVVALAVALAVVVTCGEFFIGNDWMPVEAAERPSAGNWKRLPITKSSS